MNKLFKNIAVAAFFGITITSCTPNDPTDGNPNNSNNPKLLQITSDAVNNASNFWNLQNGTLVPSVATLTTFSNLRVGDAIVSPAGLLGQTTMKWQSSAYDRVNRKYAVSLAETVVIYDMSTGSVPAPITYNVAPSGSSGLDYIMAMEYVNGNLYVIEHNEIKIFVAGVLMPIGAGITLPTSGVNSDTVSNMTSNGDTIYFTLIGKLYSFDVTTSILSSVAISGWASDTDYNGIEYCSTTNRLYATKRYSFSYSTPDDFVVIDLAGNETTMISGVSYTKDFSRISAAVDQATNVYYLSSSQGFGTNLNTITEINLLSGINTTYPGTTGYAFGLEYKN